METKTHDNMNEESNKMGNNAAVEKNALYRRTLRDNISQKREIVLDFTCLKACLDPQKETSDGEEFDYEEFVSQELSKGTAFSNVEVLKVRNLVNHRPLPPQSEDYNADLLYGMMRLSNLVELDLSRNKSPEELQKHLMFWSLERLKRLYLDKMGLTSIPPSVGRLRQLEVLSANNNSLSSLPVSLAFCENLKQLNLKDNKFNMIPSLVLRLPQLKDLRRLGNPLPQLYHGFETSPHIKVSTLNSGKQTTSAVFNPGSLQSLCAKAAFNNKIDYWTTGRVGPLQCMTLDYFATTFKLCEHCNRVVHNQREYTVEVMLLRYLDLRFVPVLFTTCSVECQSAVLQHYRTLQTQTQADIDREYEESVRLALTEAGGATRTPQCHHSRTANRRHKCIIM